MMQSSLFQKATSVETLQRAWEKCRSNNGCSGGDGVTVERFQANAALRVIDLSRQLRSDEYLPGPLRRHEIPKQDGDNRILSIPTITDRVAQSAVAAVLTPLLDPTFSDASFAYRPGRSVDQAVRAVSQHRRDGFDWVAESDIEQCFDRIDHDRLLDALDTTLHGQPDAELLIDLVAQWCETWGTSFGTPGRGLAQGSPLSPLLANLMLDQADDVLDRMAGARLVRFADDFLILCRDRDRAEKALDTMRDALEGIGLTLNPDKTRITSFDHGIRFLGRVFMRSIVMVSEESEPDEITELMRVLAGRDADSAVETHDAEAAEARDRAAGLNAGARTLYVQDRDRRLSLDDGSVVVSARTGPGWSEMLRLAPSRIDRIEIARGVVASVDDLTDMADLGIGVHILDGTGATRAELVRPLPARADLHMAQARTALDPVAAAVLARSIVEGRLLNARATLRKLNRKPKDPQVSAAAARIGRIAKKLSPVGDVGQAMHVEAEGASEYWRALRRLVQPRWAVRGGRTRNPPQDPFSAVVSYLSTLALREAGFAVHRAGLHPGFGALHKPRDYGDACVYDLVEEFRPALTEGVAVWIFNAQAVGRDDFQPAPGGGVRMSRDARGEIIRAFRRTLETSFRNPWTGRQTTWGGMLLHQARALARHHQGERAYEPYRLGS